MGNMLPMSKVLIPLYFVVLCSFAGRESDHYPAEFWQSEDGSYYVQVYSIEDGEQDHLFEFLDIKHSSLCPCKQ